MEAGWWETALGYFGIEAGGEEEDGRLKLLGEVVFRWLSIGGVRLMAGLFSWRGLGSVRVFCLVSLGPFLV